MNHEDRDLIQQVLQAVGKAGEQGFAYLVHWQLLDGLLSFVGFGIALAGAVWCLRKAFAWEIKDDDAAPVRGCLIAVLCLVIFGFLCGMINGLRDAIAPEGAAIHSVLSR